MQQWVFTTQNDVSATPAVDTAANAVYFPDWSGGIYKLNTNDGSIIWSHQMTDYGFPAGVMSRATPTLVGNMLVVTASASFASPISGVGAYLMALDTATGHQIWQVELDATPLSLVTASPIVYNGVVYIGISSAQEKIPAAVFRGSLVAVSLATGQQLWQSYMVPVGYSGGPIWSSTPAIDVARNQIYVTTGNNYTVPSSVQKCEVNAGKNAAAVLACQAWNNYDDSIVALDLTTGVVKWARKCSSTDAWNITCYLNLTTCPTPRGADFDFGSGANFYTVNIGGVPTDLVGAGQKSGTYFALNPANGAVVWQQHVGPGGMLGGIQWGTASDNQRIYVAISNTARATYNLQPSGTSWNGGSWAALDAGTGQILWQVGDPGWDLVRLGYRALALGPVTVANGVLYCADTAGLMFALDGTSGATLWNFQAPGSVNSAPAVVNGVVYWGTGYHNFPGTAPIGTASNQFYSFALPPTNP